MAPTADELDSLLSQYLEALDAYQSAQESVGAKLRDGFISLARARQAISNKSVPALAHINAQLQPQALIHVESDEAQHQVRFGVEPVTPPPAEQERDEDAPPSSAYRDPLSLYGMPSPASRLAQKHFREAAFSAVSQLAAAAARISALEVAVRLCRSRMRDEETRVNGPVDNIVHE